jgi:hypothetical protein
MLRIITRRGYRMGNRQYVEALQWILYTAKGEILFTLRWDGTPI